jgi:hypothetical protein
MSIAHKVHLADLVDVNGREASLTVGYRIHPFPPFSDMFLRWQKSAIELLIAAHAARNPLQRDGLGAYKVLTVNPEFVADLLKGE